jgi:hypothetical protein
MTKIAYAFCLLLAMVTSLHGGNGVTTQYYTDSRGYYLGRSYTNQQGQTYYYNRYGQKSGYSYQYGPATRYYGQHNQYLGDVLKRSNGLNVVRPK